MDWQTIIAVCIVALCTLYLFGRAVRWLAPRAARRAATCGECAGCTTPPRELVRMTAAASDRSSGGG